MKSPVRCDSLRRLRERIHDGGVTPTSRLPESSQAQLRNSIAQLRNSGETNNAHIAWSDPWSDPCLITADQSRLVSGRKYLSPPVTPYAYAPAIASNLRAHGGARQAPIADPQIHIQLAPSYDQTEFHDVQLYVRYSAEEEAWNNHTTVEPQPSHWSPSRRLTNDDSWRKPGTVSPLAEPLKALTMWLPAAWMCLIMQCDKVSPVPRQDITQEFQIMPPPMLERPLRLGLRLRCQSSDLERYAFRNIEVSMRALNVPF
ncbi:hypothetical protein BJX99DRAFT_261429 [Aspergillus californicus]